MDILYYAVPIVILLVVVFWFYNKNKKPVETINVSNISKLFIDNFKTIEFIRNKIVINTKNHQELDLEALKALGAKGILVVGDKVKFYFEKDNEVIYTELKKTLEG